jgi:hypothetical protein
MRVKEESINRGSFTVRKWFRCTFSQDTGLGVNSMGSLASFSYGTICVAVRWKLHVFKGGLMCIHGYAGEYPKKLTNFSCNIIE